MKYFKLILLLSISFIAYDLASQIEIDHQKKIGISQLPEEGIKMKLLNENQPKTFMLHSEYDGSEPIFGMELLLDASSNVEMQGVKNKITQTSSKLTRGMMNHIQSLGSGEVQGIYNYIEPEGNSEKFGIYNDVRQKSTSNKFYYGSYNAITADGKAKAFGSYNDVIGIGTGLKYGTFNKVHSNGGIGDTYGTYNEVETLNGKNIFGSYSIVGGLSLFHKTGSKVVVQQPENGSGQITGFNASLQPGIGVAIAFNAKILDTGDSEKIGLNVDITQDSISTKNTFGIKNYVNHLSNDGIAHGQKTVVKHPNDSSGPAKAYGHYIDMLTKAKTTGEVIGQFTNIKAWGTVGTRYGHKVVVKGGDSRYGIYSEVSGNSAGNTQDVWAGYFKGDMFIDGEQYFASDLKLKENIKDLPNTLYNILKLKPKLYNYKNDENQSPSLGFIAQEVENIFPTLVKEVNNPTTNDDALKEFKSVNYQGLIPMLVKAIQEQQSQIVQLQNQVEQLTTSDSGK